MSVEEMNLMVEEVNEREVDSIDVLSNHVYQYKRELEEIIYQDYVEKWLIESVAMQMWKTLEHTRI